MPDYLVPDGYTRHGQDSAPLRGATVEVLLVPIAGETHLPVATAVFSPSWDRPSQPWTTIHGRPMAAGRQVLAWRTPRDELRVQSITVAPGEQEVYVRAIDGLARESIDRAFGGELSDRPQNVAYVAKLFGVAETKVVEDYTARKTAILA